MLPSEKDLGLHVSLVTQQLYEVMAWDLSFLICKTG